MGVLTPLGVPNFQGTPSKDYLKLKYTISGQAADKVVLMLRKGATAFYTKVIEDPKLLAVGTHEHHWDGFDDHGILDTAFLTSHNFNFYTKIYCQGDTKFKTIDFSGVYDEVKWVDVRIDRNAKRIDVTLRVNLTDGGAKGLDSADNIPSSSLLPNQSPFKWRTQSFKDLERLALDGLRYYWGRNKNHFIAKHVNIGEKMYEVFMNPLNTEKNAMDDVELIYNTNRKWMRSGNPGTVEDPISLIGNIVSREAVCYNVGYIKYSDSWGYRYPENEKTEFAETAAHEIGHTILKAYGGTFYSYGHRGTVNTITQSKNSNATDYPLAGEIDLMKYYKNWIPYNQREKIVASEVDALSFLWLSKIQIK